MKTLDEVIEMHEFCLAIGESACGPNCKCRGRDGVCRMREDALHYLKAYREKAKDVDQILDSWRYESQGNEEANDPLTWDELKQMEGKPVWVELTFPEGAYSHWGIIWGFPKAGYEFMELWGFHEIQSFSVMQKEQGKTWQAYRKERS